MNGGLVKASVILRAMLLVLSLQLAACASLDELASAPGVSLRNVEVESLDFRSQTFLLSFGVTNPNTFPLPVRSVSYDVRLDGQRFASGAAACALSIPAGSDGEFSIRVDLDLLQTAPQLMFAMREGARRDIAYELQGELGIDISGIQPASFTKRGAVRLFSAAP